MSRIRALVFGDPHLALPAPASRLPDEYVQETEAYFRQIEQLAINLKIDFVACTGDWFHSKGNTTHACVAWAIKMLSPIVKRFGPIWTCYGNHDLSGDNIESAQSQPIGVLERAGLIRTTGSSAQDPRCSVITRHYGMTQRQFIAQLQPLDETVPWLYLAHSDSAHDQPSNHATDLVVNGHIHTPADSIEPCHTDIGCLSRVSVSEADWVSRVLVATFEKDKPVSFRYVSLSTQYPGATAFDQGVKVDRAGGASGDAIAQFAKAIQSESNKLDPVRMLERCARQSHADARHVAFARRLIQEAM